MIGELCHDAYLPNGQTNIKPRFAGLAMEPFWESPKPIATMATALPNRIKEILDLRHMTIEQLAEKSGISVSYLSRMANGHRNVSVKNLNRIAAALNCNPAELLVDQPLVPVIGTIEAGNQAHFYDEAQATIERVQMPPGATANTVALKIKGSSMGHFLNGWHVFFDNQQSVPAPDMLREICVVGLADGRTLVKVLMPGSQPQRYHLVSQFEPMMEDVEVLWAAKVIALTRP